jgi:hypothetical protein
VDCENVCEKYRDACYRYKTRHCPCNGSLSRPVYPG